MILIYTLEFPGLASLYLVVLNLQALRSRLSKINR
jgi:hypothetical protein